MKNTIFGSVSIIALTGFAHLPTDKLAQMRPPQEAVNACAGKSEGDRCTVTMGGQREEGVCRTPPGQQVRACIPGRMGGGRVGRQHTTIQSDGSLNLRPATVPPITENLIEVTIEGDCRKITGNGVAEHFTGPFPNDGNPSRITEQRYSFCLPASPEVAETATPLGLGKFAIGINGIPFDPGAAEFYLGNMRGGWRYEALSGAIRLGLDENHAHVQPTGAYHYHGLPTLHLEGAEIARDQHSPLVGWAADGFPVYALYGWADADGKDGGFSEMTSSYRLKTGARPKSEQDPGGAYDGTFVNDYEYVEGAGTLDDCNGRWTATPEFPDGTYAYFLTEDWPVIPRCFRGTPDAEFITPAPPPGGQRPRR